MVKNKKSLKNPKHKIYFLFQVRTGTSVHSPIVRPTLLSNGQTAPCVQLPSSSQKVIIRSPDGTEKQVIIPPGMELKMHNGQVILVQKSTQPNPTTSKPIPLPTQEQTIFRVSNLITNAR